MTTTIFSAVMKGWQAITVAVTVSCENGKGISISGLITHTLQRDLSRLQWALLNCGFGFKGKKIHIDVEPAIYEDGETLMLPIAIATLIANKKIPDCHDFENYCIVGGLGVTGNIHEIDNAAGITSMILSKGFSKIILPAPNIKILKFGYAKEIYAARDLISLVRFLRSSILQHKIELPSDLLEHLNFN